MCGICGALGFGDALALAKRRFGLAAALSVLAGDGLSAGRPFWSGAAPEAARPVDQIGVSVENPARRLAGRRQMGMDSPQQRHDAWRRCMSAGGNRCR